MRLPAPPCCLNRGVQYQSGRLLVRMYFINTYSYLNTVTPTWRIKEAAARTSAVCLRVNRTAWSSCACLDIVYKIRWNSQSKVLPIFCVAIISINISVLLLCVNKALNHVEIALAVYCFLRNRCHLSVNEAHSLWILIIGVKFLLLFIWFITLNFPLIVFG